MKCDLLQHRGNYPYIVTFGGDDRYRTVARLVDDELIMIYEREVVVEERVDLADEVGFELVENVEVDWLLLAPILALMLSFIIGVLLGVVVVILVIKTRKQVLSDDQ